MSFGNTLVTGATGLLGSELVDQLLRDRECARIVCLVRDFVPRSRFFIERMSERVIVVSGDVRDQALLDRVMNEYEIRTVFHLAAQTLVVQANQRPAETLDVNIRGTWALLEAMRNNPKYVKRAVIASSDKAYGDAGGALYDESFPLAGSFPYDVSKSCADLVATMYAKSFGLDVAITRCGNLFGEGDLNENRLFPSVILALLAGTRPVIRSDGRMVRDYIYVKDGAAAYRLLARRMEGGSLRGRAFNFSYGQKLSVLDVVKEISREMQSTLEPDILGQATNEIPVQCLDSTVARRELEWRPDFGWLEGVRRTIAWYRDWAKDAASVSTAR